MTPEAPPTPDKPGPTPSPISRPFWDAVERGQLLVQRCRRCGHHQHYPRALCVGCWSEDVEWTAATGRGRVWTHTVVHKPGHPAWQRDVPYVLALVELEEGPRLVSNVIGIAPAAVRVGMSVEAVFPHRDTGTGTATGTPQPHCPLLQFTPVHTAPSSTPPSSPAR